MAKRERSSKIQVYLGIAGDSHIYTLNLMDTGMANILLDPICLGSKQFLTSRSAYLVKAHNMIEDNVKLKFSYSPLLYNQQKRTTFSKKCFFFLQNPESYVRSPVLGLAIQLLSGFGQIL